MRTIHMALDVRGGIRNAKMLKGAITVDGTTLNYVSDIRAFLKSELDLGHELLPIGDCPNFDYKKGCMCWRGGVGNDEP